MGRTKSTYRDLRRTIEAEWDDYRHVLRREDQHHFERLFVHAREHADAAGHLNHEDRLAAFWMGVALEQERRLSELEERVDADVSQA